MKLKDSASRDLPSQRGIALEQATSKPLSTSCKQKLVSSTPPVNTQKCLQGWIKSRDRQSYELQDYSHELSAVSLVATPAHVAQLL